MESCLILVEGGLALGMHHVSAGQCSLVDYVSWRSVGKKLMEKENFREMTLIPC